MDSGALFLSYKQKINEFQEHTNIEKLCVSAGKMLLKICVEWAEDHWSWFDVNRSTFHEDMSKQQFSIFILSDLTFVLFICPQNINFLSR